MSKTAGDCANQSLNYLKCCHGGHFSGIFSHCFSWPWRCPYTVSVLWWNRWFLYGLETLLAVLFAFEGREAADRRSHPADWRHQRARDEQWASGPSAEELWEFCQDDCRKGPQVGSHGGSTSSPELASQHIAFSSEWKCEYLLLPWDIFKDVCGLWSERKERTECSWALKCFSSLEFPDIICLCLSRHY